MYNEVILNNFVLLDDNESEMNQTHMTDNAFGTLNFFKELSSLNEKKKFILSK